MSTEQPISILPVPEPVKTEEAAAGEALLAGPGPVVPAKDENTPAVEEKTTTTIKETEAKPSSPKESNRKPFAVLNNLFHRKEKASTPATDAKEATKEETPVVEEPAKEPVVELPTTNEAPVESTEETATTEAESPKKKDGFLDKLKHFVEKKERTPKKSKDAEEAKTEEAAPKLEEPVVEAPVAETKPEVPVVPESTPEPTVETPAVAATVDEPAKEETKEAKKDKVKMGRRLSARITGIFTSPRKEKANPLDKTPTEEKKAEEALPAPVDLPKTEVTEPVATSSEPVVEAPKVEALKVEEAAKVEEVKPEEPATTVTAVVEESKPEEPKPAPVAAA